jgi:hypothetical protein
LQALQRLNEKHAIVSFALGASIAMNAFSLIKELPIHGGLALPLAPHRASVDKKIAGSFCRVLIVIEEKNRAGRSRKVVGSRTPQAASCHGSVTRSTIFCERKTGDKNCQAVTF